MTRIGDMGDVLDRIGEQRRWYRAAQCEKYGWDAETTSCMECGDGGFLPDRPDVPCPSCEMGHDARGRQKRSTAWDQACPPRFRDCRLSTHPNRDAVSDVQRWIASVDAGTNLMLSGPVGTGKTGMAFAALRTLFIAGRTVRFGAVPDLLEAMRPRRPGDAPGMTGMRDLQKAGVLLLDDLGVEKASDWQRERLYMAINDRYERRLPTIITTNKTGSQLRDHVGEATMSRLMQDCTIVTLDGRDLRQRGVA